MGSIYIITPSGRVLGCDICGSAGGRVRACPSRWCPPAAVCSRCWKPRRAEFAELHAGCAARSAQYHAEVAARRAADALEVPK